ncbi:MAG TPA: sigma-70 family RNA polymerase sigma factor [Thermoanaerobaculia bacterium]|nr:sigma-70 family RNA polymerase sigma factor [Thermoanaerobaculia bacterium]
MAQHDGDLELRDRLLAGDEAAFETFAERCLPAVHRFALARLARDRDEARELVQAAMVKALSRLATYRGEASLTTWLCSCCRHESLMHRRRSRSAPIEVALADEPAFDGAPGGLLRSPDDALVALLQEEEGLRVHMALDQLGEPQARALEWKYVEGVKVDEIATRLGVTPKAAESLLTRARVAFRARYESLAGAARAAERERRPW